MTTALYFAVPLLSVALVAAVLWFHEWNSDRLRRKAIKDAEDAAWVDSLIERNRAELQRRYRNGQFRPKALYDKTR